MNVKLYLRSILLACSLVPMCLEAQEIKSPFCSRPPNDAPPSQCDPAVVTNEVSLTFVINGRTIDAKTVSWSVSEENGQAITPGKESVLRPVDKEPGKFIALQQGFARVKAVLGDKTAELDIPVYTLGNLLRFKIEAIPGPLQPNETYTLVTKGEFEVGGTTKKDMPANDRLRWNPDPPLQVDQNGNITTTQKTGDFKVFAFTADRSQSDSIDVAVRSSPARPRPAFDEDAPGIKRKFFATFLGGAEQVDLSSLPSQTEPFVRVFLQSAQTSLFKLVPDARLWGAIRLLGAPEQTDTRGIFSVFANPTGQVDSTKLSSVGTALDFLLGPSIRINAFTDTKNSIDLFVGFGATTPLQGNKVTQAFVVPAFGTAECNILVDKYGGALGRDPFRITPSKDGKATESTDACLLNQNSVTVTNGASTFTPIKTLAFSNQDKSGFFLKDMIGVRMNHTAQTGTGSCAESSARCALGSLDFSFGHDAAITGGVLRGNRWVFKADGVYPIALSDVATFYLFGSFATRLSRRTTDNTPLILQPASLPTLTGTGTGSVPNPNTVVLPLSQPDRDFYRIGVGIDILSLVTRKTEGK